MSKPKPRYWYFISIRECALCSHTDETRERRYDPKPEKSEDRHEWAAFACSEHFL